MGNLWQLEYKYMSQLLVLSESCFNYNQCRRDYNYLQQLFHYTTYTYTTFNFLILVVQLFHDQEYQI